MVQKIIKSIIKKYAHWKRYNKCEHCNKSLWKYGDNYHGAIDIKDTIGGHKRRTAYLCNLCYYLFSK